MTLPGSMRLLRSRSGRDRCCDTGPINYLILIGAVDVLSPLFDRVVVPRTVVAELRDARTPAAVRDWIAQPPAWLNIAADPPRDETLNRLDPGERAAINLACLLHATRLLIDDSDGRAEAERRGLKVTGTLGVLASAYRAGLVDFDSTVTRLLATSFYVSPRLLATARRLLFPGGRS